MAKALNLEGGKKVCRAVRLCLDLRDHHLKIIISKICMNVILTIKQNQQQIHKRESKHAITKSQQSQRKTAEAEARVKELTKRNTVNKMLIMNPYLSVLI